MNQIKKVVTGILFVVFVFLLAQSAFADESTSTSFTLENPVITIAGGRATSTSFELFGAVGQLAPIENVSFSFTQRGGFLYFPIANSPGLTAASGNGSISLFWTISVGIFANITNYYVGTSLAPGGPYTYESVGNVLSFVKAGLTNGTTYYFKVKAYAGTLFLSESLEASAVPATGGAPPLPPGPGGGGGGGIVSTQVIFSGRAYPLSKVVILKDGQIAVTTIAGPDANFNIALTGLSQGNYIFSVYGEDSGGRKSALFSFPTFVSEGATITISGIFLAPTIAVDKTEVRKGDTISIFGQSAPQSDVTIAVNSNQDFFVKAKSDTLGSYLYNFDTVPLDYGQHFTKSKAAIGETISPYSKTVGFAVGTKSIFAEVGKKFLKGDLNDDNRVNLIDFSIAAYWYYRPFNQDFRLKEAERLNGDGKIDLVDFSIMAYYWTG